MSVQHGSRRRWLLRQESRVSRRGRAVSVRLWMGTDEPERDEVVRR
jgi:hypothetical protein